MLTELNIVESIDEIRKGQLLVIKRKRDDRRLLVRCVDVLNINDGHEILLSKGRNDYFNFDMYLRGESWVWRVWALPRDVEITAITNNMTEFPR